MTITAMKPEIEQVLCSRCLGSGKHSWCSAHGDTCFKCRGRGKVMTARGRVVNAYITELRWAKVEASTILPGRKIQVEHAMAAGSFVSVVEAVTQADGMVKFKVAGCPYLRGYKPTALVVARSGIGSEESYLAGVEIQGTLTKAGKPTKRTPADVAAWINSRNF